MELTQKTEEELTLLRDQIDAELKSRREAKIQQLRADLKKAADELGVRMEELVKKPSASKPRGKVAPKYQNPSNPDETWTGRGQKPGWVRDALAAGKTLDQLLIQ